MPKELVFALPQAASLARGEEAQELIAQSIQHLKDRLGRPGLKTEEIAARAARLPAEAELAKATAAKSQAQADETELRLLARRLRLVIEAERAELLAAVTLGAGLLRRRQG